MPIEESKLKNASYVTILSNPSTIELEISRDFALNFFNDPSNTAMQFTNVGLSIKHTIREPNPFFSFAPNRLEFSNYSTAAVNNMIQNIEPKLISKNIDLVNSVHGINLEYEIKLKEVSHPYAWISENLLSGNVINTDSNVQTLGRGIHFRWNPYHQGYIELRIDSIQRDSEWFRIQFNDHRITNMDSLLSGQSLSDSFSDSEEQLYKIINILEGS